jgi:CspA family cold shock protein
MNSSVKNIIISILVGLVAFFIFSMATGNGLSIPSDSHEILALATYVLAVFVGCTISTLPGSANAGSKPANSKAAPSKPSGSGSKEQGTVKWFNIKKGYGFITRDQGDDIFVHYRNIEGNGRKAVAEGQRVQFFVVDGDKGLQADEVEAL